MQQKQTDRQSATYGTKFVMHYLLSIYDHFINASNLFFYFRSFREYKSYGNPYLRTNSVTLGQTENLSYQQDSRKLLLLLLLHILQHTCPKSLQSTSFIQQILLKHTLMFMKMLKKDYRRTSLLRCCSKLCVFGELIRCGLKGNSCLTLSLCPKSTEYTFVPQIYKSIQLAYNIFSTVPLF